MVADASDAVSICRSLRADVIVANLAAASFGSGTAWPDIVGQFGVVRPPSVDRFDSDEDASERSQPRKSFAQPSDTGTDSGARLVAMCLHDPDIAAGLLDAGALGVLPHDADGSELVAAVRAVAGGYVYLSPRLAGQVIALLRQRPLEVGGDLAPLVQRLTKRERDVLDALARGQNVEEAANELFITPATVRTHIYRLRHKLSARDRAELVSFAFRAGVTRTAEVGRRTDYAFGLR